MTERGEASEAPQVVRPDTADVGVVTESAEILVKTHLWLYWAKIAVRQERRAWAARERGQSTSDYGPFLALETEEAIQAVAAARHSLHNLFRVWKPLIGVEEEREVSRGHLTSDTVSNADEWENRVRDLIEDRNEAVHHDEEFVTPRRHPGYETNVSGVAATFTAERATDAVDVLLHGVLRPVLTKPSSNLKAFAREHRHVLEKLEQQRAGKLEVW